MIYYDPLTGLANRALFYDRAHKSLSRARREDGVLAVLLLDLNGFNAVLEKVGRDGGDRYLRAVARNFLEDIRDTDNIARIGENEFVLLLEDIANLENISSVIEKLIESVNAPVNINGEELLCSANIGISMFPQDGEAIDTLLQNADRAMFSAANKGENCCAYYKAGMESSKGHFLLLENDLLHALENNEFQLFYQPQFNLVSGEIVGLEALLRWQSKTRGLISPAQFIPLAEETGLIDKLGEWVLLEASFQFQSWLNRGIDFKKVAVNLSVHQFRQPDFEETISSVLADSNLSAEHLELEITESATMDNAAETIELLQRLSDMGLSLSIDDFGTGYSSLAYLKNFPIHKLKIDKSFIQDVDVSAADAAIAKSIIDLAHNLNLQVIAEGVECVQQLDWLREHNCDLVQGDYYSSPLSEEELMAFIDSDQVLREKGELKLRA